MKIAVSGSSGWLARSLYFAVESLKARGLKLEIDFFSRASNQIRLVDGTLLRTETDLLATEKKYDLYIPLAFLTREKYNSLGEDEYQILNNRIIGIDAEFASKNHNLKTLLISSGVVLTPSIAQSSDASYMYYAKMKKLQENVLRETIGNLNLNICYLYSCTSRDMYSLDYAFSSLVNMANQGKDINLENEKPVLRKYIDLRQLFEVMIQSIYHGDNFRISSEGELIEIEDLANRIVSVLKSKSKITRKQNGESLEDIYYSSDRTMSELFDKYNCVPISIETQILNVLEGIKKI